VEDKREKLDALDTEGAVELTGEDMQFITRTALGTFFYWSLVGLVCGGLLYYTFYMLRAFEPKWLYPWRDYFAYFYVVGWLAAGAIIGYKLAVLKIARYLIQKVKVTEFLIKRIFSSIVTGAVKLRTQQKEIKDFGQLGSNLTIEEADELLSATLREYRKKDFNWRTGKGLVKRTRKFILSRTKKFLTHHAAFFLLDEFREEYHESLGEGVHLSHVEERALHLLEQYMREKIAGSFSRAPSMVFGFATFLSILLPLVDRVLDALYTKYLGVAELPSPEETSRSAMDFLRNIFPHLPVIISIGIPFTLLAVVLIIKRKLIQRKILS